MSHETSVNFLAIDLKLKLVDSTTGCLRIVPDAQSTQSNWLLEQEHDVVRLTLFRLVFLGTRRASMALGVLVGGEPDMIVTHGLVLAVDQVSNDANVIVHTLKGVHTRGVSVDSTLVSSRTTHIVPILVKQLDSIQANVEEVAMSGVEVESKQEANRHRNGLTLL